jgi:sugar lactone lactonase YvrE
VIYRYAFDADTGRIGARLLFADTSLLSGVPDGVCVDADGLLWCAFWDGGAVRAFDMSGQVRITIPVPALRPTSIAFGGEDLCTIYVTTARLGLTDEQLAQWPASGSVLQLRSEHRGRPAYIFGSSGKGAA